MAATDAPGNNSSKLPEASAVVLADQGAPTITLTSVFALLTTGTKEAIMEGEVEAKLGVLQKPLAPAKIWMMYFRPNRFQFFL